MNKDASFSACREFALFQCRNATLQEDRFFGKCDVAVDNLLYRNIDVAVAYQVPYMDFRVDILWEQDASQKNYKDVGLHGYYSSNFQSFSFDETANSLSFNDGIHRIVVHPV